MSLYRPGDGDQSVSQAHGLDLMGLILNQEANQMVSFDRLIRSEKAHGRMAMAAVGLILCWAFIKTYLVN